jgi:hypothetical protein
MLLAGAVTAVVVVAFLVPGERDQETRVELKVPAGTSATPTVSETPTAAAASTTEDDGGSHWVARGLALAALIALAPVSAQLWRRSRTRTTAG